jgi:hypothetical protein
LSKLGVPDPSRLSLCGSLASSERGKPRGMNPQGIKLLRETVVQCRAEALAAGTKSFDFELSRPPSIGSGSTSRGICSTPMAAGSR